MFFSLYYYLHPTVYNKKTLLKSVSMQRDMWVRIVSMCQGLKMLQYKSRSGHKIAADITPPSKCSIESQIKDPFREEAFCSHWSDSVISDSHGDWWSHPLASSFDGKKGHVDWGNFSELELEEHTHKLFAYCRRFAALLPVTIHEKKAWPIFVLTIVIVLNNNIP